MLRRRREGHPTEYRDVQVKFGKLYDCTRRWENGLFDVTSWRFFKDGVLAHDNGFRGDMFVFPAATFARVVRRADKLGNGSYRLYLSRAAGNINRWYVRRKSRFETLDESNVVDVTAHYRDFACLG